MAKPHEPEPGGLDDETFTDIIAAVIFLLDRPGVGGAGVTSAIDQARQAFDKAESFLAVRRERAKS